MKFADLVSTLGIVQGILLGAFIFAAHRRALPTRLLGIFILTLALRAIPFLLIRLPYGQAHPIVLYLPVYFWYTGVPVLYLYAKQLSKQLVWSRDWMHLIPGITEFALLGALFVLEFLVGGRLFGLHTTRGILGVYTILAIGPAVYYSYLTVKMLEAHQEFLLSYYSNLKDKQIRWIRNSLYWVLAQAVIYTMMRYGPLPVPTQWRILFGAVSNTGVIYYLSYFGIKQLGLKPQGEEGQGEEQTVDPQSKPEENQCSAGYTETFRQVEEYLTKSEVYLDPGLTIADLASALHCSKRTLSRVINSESDEHFNGYINGYRVAAARKLLLDNHYDHYSMDGIATEVGFNSKATFYQAFKKYSPVSPATFRRRRSDGGEVEA